MAASRFVASGAGMSDRSQKLLCCFVYPQLSNSYPEPPDIDFGGFPCYLLGNIAFEIKRGEAIFLCVFVKIGELSKLNIQGKAAVSIKPSREQTPKNLIQ